MSVESKSDISPTQKVVQAVAEREGVDPIELEPPLFDVLDGDMLDSLVCSNEQSDEAQSLEISFSYHGYDVHVDATGAVTVEPLE